MSIVLRSIYVPEMTTPDPDSLADLIADCADIPAGIRTARESIPMPHRAAGWAVTDACLDQVREIEDY